MTGADLVFEDVDDARCPTCFKRLAVDLGQDFYGHAVGVRVCVNCGPVEQLGAWELANIRAAVVAVTNRSSSRW